MTIDDQPMQVDLEAADAEGDKTASEFQYIEEEMAQEADAGKTDGAESARTGSEKDTAPPDGMSENDQSASADGDQPEKTNTDIDEAAEQSEDEAETAETDTTEAAEQSEDKPENAESDKEN